MFREVFVCVFVYVNNMSCLLLVVCGCVCLCQQYVMLVACSLWLCLFMSTMCHACCLLFVVIACSQLTSKLLERTSSPALPGYMHE